MKVFQFTASLLIASITLTLVCGACISDRRRREMTAEERKQAMNLTLEWGRLATLPHSASDLTIKVEGGFFTRTFRSSFRAPRRDIDIWIKESPGLMDAGQTYAGGKIKFGVPYGNRTRVAAVKEKRPVVIQGNSAAWMALYRTQRTHGNAYWTLNGLARSDAAALYHRTPGGCELGVPVLHLLVLLLENAGTLI